MPINTTTAPAANDSLFDKAKAKWASFDNSGKGIVVMCVVAIILLGGIFSMQTSETSSTIASAVAPATTSTTTTMAPASAGAIDPVKQGNAIADGVGKKFEGRYKAIENAIAAVQTGLVKTDGRLQKLETPVSDDYYTTLRDTIAGVKK